MAGPQVALLEEEWTGGVPGECAGGKAFPDYTVRRYLE